MKSSEDIEAYLMRLGLPYEAIADAMWSIKVAERETLVVSLAGPLVVFRIKVMQVPGTRREEFFRTLLELNTTDLVHGAFGLEGDAVVIVAALALETLDYQEFQGTVDDIGLSIGKLYPQLARFREAA